MSQVHHGSKMLNDLPDDLAPPCVCVDRSVYFVHELLQQATGQYFIPKKFFQAQALTQEEPSLLALGHQVSKTAVCSWFQSTVTFIHDYCRRDLPLTQRWSLFLLQRSSTRS